jgi:hypothetical protein
MKKKILALSIVFMLLLVGFLAVNAIKPGIDFNGPHFNLNLIGKKKAMPGDYEGTHRHVMFIPQDTSDYSFTNPEDPESPVWEGIKISITQGSEFLVVDGDATDGYGELQLGADKYKVYIAVRAKNPKVEDAFTDIDGWVEAYDNTGALWYYIHVGDVSVSKGKNKWTDATDLLFVDSDEDPFGYYEWQTQYPIFDEGIWVFDYMSGLDTWYEDSAGESIYDFSNLAYFWQVVNSGNKLIQVRFYPI